MSETAEEPRFESREDAYAELEALSGQSVVTADTAWEILRHFADPFEDALELQDAITEESERLGEMRPIVTSEPQWRSVMSAAEMSALLVDAYGGEPSTATMGGTGYTHDARHKENLSTLDSLLDLEGDDDE